MSGKVVQQPELDTASRSAPSDPAVTITQRYAFYGSISYGFYFLAEPKTTDLKD